MSEDSFSEQTDISWGARIKAAFKGILVGLIFFVGAFPLLFWNEGRAVKRYQTLKEGQGAVVSISSDAVDGAFEGRLVHVSGDAATRERVSDPTFNLTRQAIHLKRTVEMYQWKENRKTSTEKKVGGGEKKVTTYTYSRGWSASLIHSSAFKRRSGHENPSSMPFETRTFTASRVTLGAFALPPALVREIDNWRPLAVDASAALPAALGGDARVHDGGYYRGRNPDHPMIGDVRIRFNVVDPGPVSLIAAQQGHTFGPYTTDAGGTISLLQTGAHSAAEMFQTAHFHNRLLTWGIRAGGLLLMFIGLAMILKPLSVFADVIPLVGSLVAAGSGVVAFVLALFFSLMVIGLAWIFYRPLLGISLLAAALALVAGVVVKRRSGNKPGAAIGGATPIRPKAVSPPPPPIDTQATAPPLPPDPPPVPPPVDPPARSVDEWIQAGKDAYVAGDFHQAAAAFDKAVALEPENQSAVYNLGVARDKIGDAAGAMDAFQRAADLGHERARAVVAARRRDG